MYCSIFYLIQLFLYLAHFASCCTSFKCLKILFVFDLHLISSCKALSDFVFKKKIKFIIDIILYLVFDIQSPAKIY